MYVWSVLIYIMVKMTITISIISECNRKSH